mmetsp:Transcript_33315/g.66069  ORF Transcript_33315/g.66069 Transcript_33315/m.66069 type:complete len:201 (+) Transcript_33315:411-1013(+)
MPNVLVAEASHPPQYSPNGKAIMLFSQKCQTNLIFHSVFYVHQAENKSENSTHQQSEQEYQVDLCLALHERLCKRRLSEPKNKVDEVDNREDQSKRDRDSQQSVKGNLGQSAHVGKPMTFQKKAQGARQNNHCCEPHQLLFLPRAVDLSLPRNSPHDDQPNRGEENPKIHCEKCAQADFYQSAVHDHTDDNPKDKSHKSR